MTVYSVRVSDPMLPTVTYPVLIPMPTFSSSSPWSVHRVRRLAEPLAHLERRRDGAFSMVLERDRVAEEREDPVADVLVERAAVAEDDVGHHGEVLIEPVDQLLGLHALGHRRESADVGEQDRQVAARRGQRDRGSALEHRVGDLRREVAAELLRPVELVELVVHLLLEVRVERRQIRVQLRELIAGPVQVDGEPAELVAVGDLDVLAEVAAGDPREREVHLADGSDDRPRQRRPEPESDQQAQAREDHDGEQQEAVQRREARGARIHTRSRCR